MIKVVVVGACGRMGGEVARLIIEQNDMKLIAGVEAAGHPLLGTAIGSGFVVADLSRFLCPTVDSRQPIADVVVDFSIPDAVIENVQRCVQAGKPFITGVTGLNETQMQALKTASEKIPVVYAPNFSVGVCVLARLVVEASALLQEDYDVHIIETHHKRKKDAPSGTAKMLLEKIKAKIGEREVGMSSIRTGDVVGEHKVIFGGPGERLELTHKAESRVAFAAGVITAIRFVQNRPPGFYSIADILKKG
ncbi:MAG: 4-hydroxy-tetrahydrodipicolinate reductase [candidate division WOR-3 bacterium]